MAGEPAEGRPPAIERMKRGAMRFAVMFAYLLVVFSLFQLHEFIVLEEHGLPYTRFGFALVNALVMAKVMLVADELHLGEMRKERPLAAPILLRSALFAVIFIVFDLAEKSLKAVLKGEALQAGMPAMGAGAAAVILAGVILTVMLMPFFAFLEISHVIGLETHRQMLFSARRPAETALTPTEFEQESGGRGPRTMG